MTMHYMKEKGFTPLQILKDSLLTICKLRNKDSGRLIDPHKKFVTGFTLVEIMVSVVIIVIIAGGLFGAFVGAQRFLIKARYRLQAYISEKEVLDKLRSDSQWADNNMSEGLSPHKASDIGVNVSGELSRLLLNVNPDTDFTYNVQGNETDPYKTVTVTLKLDWSKLE